MTQSFSFTAPLAVPLSPTFQASPHEPTNRGLNIYQATTPLGGGGGSFFDESLKPVCHFEIQRKSGLGKILRLPGLMEALLGYKAEEAQLMSLFDFFHPDDTRILVEKLAALRKGEIFPLQSARLQRKGGFIFPRDISVSIKDQEERTIGIVQIEATATERKLNDAFIRNLKTNSVLYPDALVTLEVERVGENLSRSIIDYASSGVRMFGYSPDEFVGQELTKIIPPQFHEHHNRGMRLSMDTGQWRLPTRYNLRLPAIHRTKGEMLIEFSIFSRFPIKGGRVHYTAIISNVTHEPQHEALKKSLSELASLESSAGLEGTEIQTESIQYSSYSDFMRALMDPQSRLSTTFSQDDLKEVSVTLVGNAAAEMVQRKKDNEMLQFLKSMAQQVHLFEGEKRIRIELKALDLRSPNRMIELMKPKNAYDWAPIPRRSTGSFSPAGSL